MSEEIVHIQRQQNTLAPATIEAALEMARLMASAKLVPTHLRDSPGDCLLVINQAVRWGLDPLAVAQATSVVQGKLCYEGKLVAAVLVATGAIVGRPDYEFEGSGDDRTITISAKTADGKVRTIRGNVRDWKSNNRYWQSQPDDMLIYRGIRQWARRYAPEAVLGIVTPDEMLDEAGNRIPNTGRRPSTRATAEVTGKPATTVIEPAEESVLDAEEVSPNDSDPKDNAYLALIEESDTIDKLLEVKEAISLSYGSDVPAVVKNAWAEKKKSLRRV